MKFTYRLMIKCARIAETIRKAATRWLLRWRCIPALQVEKSGLALVNYTLDDVEYIYMLTKPNVIQKYVTCAFLHPDDNTKSPMIECTDIMNKVIGPHGDWHKQLIRPMNIILSFYPNVEPNNYLGMYVAYHMNDDYEYFKLMDVIFNAAN